MVANCVIYLVGQDVAFSESLAQAECAWNVRIERFDDAETFLHKQASLPLGCIITEQDLPGMTGLEFQQKLKSQHSTTPIIFLSQIHSLQVAVKAMENGALTFLEKPVSQTDLCLYVKRALQFISEHKQDSENRKELRERFAALTAEERRVLENILDGVPNKTIATKLDIGLRTVELRRSNIMKKINAQSFSELIRLAIQINFPHDQQNSN
jgi:two-component system, LuxR family, response regulator FixJ